MIKDIWTCVPHFCDYLGRFRWCIIGKGNTLFVSKILKLLPVCSLCFLLAGNNGNSQFSLLVAMNASCCCANLPWWTPAHLSWHISQNRLFLKLCWLWGIFTIQQKSDLHSVFQATSMSILESCRARSGTAVCSCNSWYSGNGIWISALLDTLA